MKNTQTNLMISLIAILLCAVFIIFLKHHILFNKETTFLPSESNEPAIEVVSGTDGNYIKWVDFKVSYEALCEAYDLDVKTYGEDVHLNWIELLAYTGAKSGGSFGKGSVAQINKLAKELAGKETTLDELTKDMEYYEYYYEAYEAVLGGMVGEYEIEQDDDTGRKVWKKVYGLKAFSPIAKGFEYNDYDDFGSSRSYGYKRQHLGHDMMGQIGTPI